MMSLGSEPGGYAVGDKIFFTGMSHTFPNGDKLVHGKQGEVTTGPADFETHKGNGVAVRFPGNKDNIECFVTEVRRPRRPRYQAHAYASRDDVSPTSFPLTAGGCVHRLAAMRRRRCRATTR